MGVIVALVTGGFLVALPCAGAAPPPSGEALGGADLVLARATPAAAEVAILAAAVVVLAILWVRGTIRPSKLEGSGRNVSGVPAPAWLIAAAMVFFASQLGGGLAQGLPAAVLGGGGSLRQEGIINLCGYGAAVGVGGFLVYLLLPRAPGAGLRARWSDVPRGLLAFVAAMPVVLAAGIGAAAAAKLITGHEPPVVGHGTLQQILDERTNPWVWAIIVGAVIGAPITEELTFRAFLQSGLLRASGSPVLAILVTGTVFALMHVGIAGVHTLPTLLVLGLAMGIAFERTKRLGVPITMHAAFNVAMLVMAMAGG